MGALSRQGGRDERVDAVRFFAIGLVVLTHLLNLRWEFKTLAPWMVESMLAFNMPLFAFVSGHVLSGREGADPLKFLRGKAQALLVPYFAWVAVEMPLRNLEPEQWGARLLQAVADPRAGFQMWFLWVLFLLFTIFVLVRMFGRSDGVLAVTAAGSVLASVLSGGVVTGVEKVMWLYPFFCFGFLVAERGLLARVQPWMLAMGGAGVFVVLRLLEPPGGAAAFLTATAGVLAVWGAYHSVSEGLIRPQAWAGRRTMGVYGGQMVILPFLIMGTGWAGVSASWVAVVSAALILTLALERSAVTRALFLGAGLRRRDCRWKHLKARGQAAARRSLQ